LGDQRLQPVFRVDPFFTAHDAKAHIGLGLFHAKPVLVLLEKAVSAQEGTAHDAGEAFEGTLAPAKHPVRIEFGIF